MYIRTTEMFGKLEISTTFLLLHCTTTSVEPQFNTAKETH